MLVCISILGPSSSISSSLVILFIHLAFSLCFLVAIFSFKIVWFLLHPVVDVCFHVTPSQLLIEFSFGYLECPVLSIVLPFVDISFIFLLSPVLPCLFPQNLLLFFSCVACSFFPCLFQRLSFFIILVVFLVFLFAFLVEFPISVLTEISHILARSLSFFSCILFVKGCF